MTYIPQAPFRRSLECILSELPAREIARKSSGPVDKWEVLRDLATARTSYGLSDRDLSVLQALISFHPDRYMDAEKAPLIVFPSNKSICERLNGMPCSTMRRHIAALVASGLIIRRDSPNGKRYARQYGPERVAYGFDLAPLAASAQDIADAANEQRHKAARIKSLRETLTLMRRDLSALVEDGRRAASAQANWDALSDLVILTARTLRRKLALADLEDIRTRLDQALNEAKAAINWSVSEKMSTSNAQNEQHYQSTEKNHSVSKPENDEHPRQLLCHSAENHPSLPVVVSACKEIRTYCDAPIRSWPEFLRAADTVAPMMGISRDIWSLAKTQMGSIPASIALAAMLERFQNIRSPSAYLRVLGRKALEGSYHSHRTIAALGQHAT